MTDKLHYPLRSSLGDCSPSNNLDKGLILAVLKAYLDGSGKADDPQIKFVSLAGFAADESDWASFDREWKSILRDRGNPCCMHMADAIQHTGEFDGWDAEKTNFLIQGLMGLLVEVNHSPRFCGFQSSVDLEQHRKYKPINNIPPVAVLCANAAFTKFFDWYSKFPDPIIGRFELFFDRGDPFLDVLMQQWNNREIAEEQPWWALISAIVSVKACDSPAVQAADMLAWSYNRIKISGSDGWAGKLANDIQSTVQLDADGIRHAPVTRA